MPTLPLIRGRYLQSFLQVMERQGVCPRPLLDRHEIPDAALVDPDAVHPAHQDRQKHPACRRRRADAEFLCLTPFRSVRCGGVDVFHAREAAEVVVGRVDRGLVLDRERRDVGV